ncbi:MAG TPA: tetratricopeptide repeat protein [Pyrinomonadaceae bacterium]|nr:tetratricopeptide repeat protein [Pyrinomonadaceae bacterium]
MSARAVFTLAVALCVLAPAAPRVTRGEARRAGPSPAAVQRPGAQGRTFQAPPLTAEARRDLEAKLDAARRAYERNPSDADAVIWLGRRTAYLGRFEEAIAVFTEGITKHPEDARLYRHRGHRYLTLRQFDLAVKDLERAAKLIRGRPDETEPDGLPNARNIPTSTLHSNVWYHLGLAHYLRGDFGKALRAYRECLKFSNNPDMLAATAHWLYMTLRRMKRHDEARQILALVRDDADIIENREYQRLLLMYKGTLEPERLLSEAAKQQGSLGFATTAYGVGNWYLYHGDRDRARTVFLRVVAGPQQTSFGYIAAEAELRRMGVPVSLPPPTMPTRVIYE